MTYLELYCRSGGSNLNAGSTNADAAVYSGVGDSDGTSVFTPSDGSTPASTVAVGDIGSVYVTSGATVPAFVGRITTVAAGVNGAVTFDTTKKFGTFPASSAGAHTISMKTGGAWKSPTGSTTFPFNVVAGTLQDTAGDYPRLNIAGTLNMTASIPHSVAGPLVIQGMTSSPGDLGKLTIDAGTSQVNILNVSGAQVNVRDVIVQNNGTAGSSIGMILSGGRQFAERCVANNTRGAGFALQSNAEAIECEAYTCNKSNSANTGGFQTSGTVNLLTRCASHGNTAGSNAAGFVSSSAHLILVDCIADANIGPGLQVASSGFAHVEGGVFNANHPGINVSNNSCNVTAENVCFVNNVSFGVVNSGTGNYVRLINCGYFGSTSSGVVDETGNITFSVNPLNNTATGDFSPTPGSGAVAAGRGVYVLNSGSYSGSTVAYPDIGLQSRAGLAGVGTCVIVGGDHGPIITE